MRDMPPHEQSVESFPSTEAEQAVLGAILVNNDALSALNFLGPEHFFDAFHGDMYAKISERVSKGEKVSPVTLRPLYEHNETIKSLGGPNYLVKLVDSAITVFNVESYARVIVENAARRRMSGEALEAVRNLRAGSAPDDVASELAAKWTAGATRSDDRLSQAHTAMDAGIAAMEEAEQRQGEPGGVTTGVRDLDHTIGGFEPEQLYVLAGRPSMGKTALAVSFCASALRDGQGAFFASLEMSNRKLMMRMASNHAEIGGNIAPYHDAEQGRLVHPARSHFLAAATELRSAPIIIDDTPQASIAHLRASIMRAKAILRRDGFELPVVFVDYLQLMRPPVDRRGNKVAEVTDISNSLIALAKEQRVAVVALSQLSREVDKREDRRPRLSDLRESGAIEQDADCVMFVYREEYYLQREEPQFGASMEDKADWHARMDAARNSLQIIVSKNRHGPLKTVETFCDVRTNTVRDLARQPEGMRAA